MHISLKENTYWKKQRHMNLHLKKQLFLCNFIHNTGIKSYLQWRSSALEGFPQPSKSQPFIPLSGVYIYHSSGETILRNKPTYCFQSQSCINNIKSGTITTFYKYKQALWSYSTWKRGLIAQCFLPPHYVKVIPHVACRQFIFNSGHFGYTFPYL